MKSHLFPRALIHDVRADSKYVVSGSRFEDGKRFVQSGAWSNLLLCDKHERYLHPYDDYGVAFCRTFNAKAEPVLNGEALQVPNPKPALLNGFVLACIWRHLVLGERRAERLGRYEAIVRRALFDGEGLGLPFLVTKPRVAIGHKDATERFVMSPSPSRISGLNFWRFVVGGVQFDALADRRPLPADAVLLAANSADPIIALASNAVDLRQQPGVMHVVQRMKVHAGRRGANRSVA